MLVSTRAIPSRVRELVEEKFMNARLYMAFSQEYDYAALSSMYRSSIRKMISDMEEGRRLVHRQLISGNRGAYEISNLLLSATEDMRELSLLSNNARDIQKNVSKDLTGSVEIANYRSTGISTQINKLLNEDDSRFKESLDRASLLRTGLEVLAKAHTEASRKAGILTRALTSRYTSTSSKQFLNYFSKAHDEADSFYDNDVRSFRKAVSMSDLPHYPILERICNACTHPEDEIQKRNKFEIFEEEMLNLLSIITSTPPSQVVESILNGTIYKKEISHKRAAEYFNNAIGNPRRFNVESYAVITLINPSLLNPVHKISSSVDNIYLIQMYGLFIFRVVNPSLRRKTSCPEYSTLMKLHLSRAYDFMRSLSTLVLHLPGYSLSESPCVFVRLLMSSIMKVARYDPEFVGEAIKGARNILVASLDESDYLDTKLSNLMQQTMSDEKQIYVNVFKEFLENSLLSKIDRVLISHIYKLVMHPDVELTECMISIEGLKTPNRTDDKFLMSFRGELRKSVLSSLISQGYSPRLTSADIDDLDESRNLLGSLIDHSKGSRSKHVEPVLSELNKTNVNVDKVRRTPSSRFVWTKFEKLQGLPDPVSVSIPIQDKSSAPNIEKYSRIDDKKRSTASLESKFNIGYNIPSEISQGLKPVNDLETAIKNEDELNIKNAVDRFEKLIKLAEEFENEYLADNVKIEDIPQEQYEGFLKKNKEYLYLVGTEPKLGEKHKRTTRIFYMAEQSLKVLTQCLERTNRHISRKQSGVSITKSNNSRKRDMQSFAHSLTSQSDEAFSLIISFDMSEFSKKFPMSTIREYGLVMAELTGHSWMRRLDLFFRMTVVYHSSRGYFDELIGVKGGFEGFLNFVWSSIHATVMKLALDSAGYKGTVLTYSDDGLLRIVFSKTQAYTKEILSEAVKNCLMHIKGVYQKLGLDFHLGKTFVSSNMWEYLGDICYNGRILNNSIKEICGIFSTDKKPGFLPIMHKVTEAIAQTKAVVAKGGNPLISEIALLWEVSLYLTRKIRNIDMTTKAYMLVAPAELGGLGIPSSITMIASPIHGSFASNLFDLEQVSERYPSIMNIAMNIMSSTDKGSECDNVISALRSGNQVRPSLPDYSGIAEMTSLAAKLMRKTGLPDSDGIEVIDKSSYKDMMIILSNLTNIDFIQLGMIYRNSPGFMAISKIMQLPKAALSTKVLGRKEMKAAQSSNTRKFRDSLRVIMSIDTRSPMKKSDLFKEFNKLQKKLYPTLDVKEIRRPEYSNFKIVNEPTGNDVFSIKVSLINRITSVLPVDITRGSFHSYIMSSRVHSINDIGYVEPLPSDSASRDLLTWSSEFSQSQTEHYSRMFLKVCTTVMLSNLESAGVIREFISLFGVRFPEKIVTYATNAVKVKKITKSKAELIENIHSAVKTNIIIRPSVNYSKIYHTKERFDRTTLPIYLRSIAYLYISASPKKEYLGKELVLHITRSVVTLNEFRQKVMMPSKDHEKRLRRIEYRGVEPSAFDVSNILATMDEEMEENKLESYTRLISDQSESKYEEAAKTMRELLIYDILSILKRSVTEPSMSTLTNPPIIDDSIVLLPDIQVEIYARFIIWFMRRNLTSFDLYIDAICLSKGEVFNEAHKESFIESAKFLDQLHDSLKYLPVIIYDSEKFKTVFRSRNLLKRTFKNQLQLKEIGKYTSRSLVVVPSSSYGPGKATPEKVGAIKASMLSLIEELYKSSSGESWFRALKENPKLSKSLVKELNLSVDTFTNVISVMYDCLRPSKHRSLDKPYNKKSYMIRMMSIYSCKASLLQGLVKEVTRGADVPVSRDVIMSMLDDLLSSIEVLKGQLLRSYIPAGLRGYLVKKLGLTAESRDHNAQLLEPISEKHLRRSIYTLRSELQNYNTMNFKLSEVLRLDFNEWFNEIILDEHAVYQVILSGIIKKIVVYRKEYQEDVYENAPNYESFKLIRLHSSEYSAMSKEKLNVKVIPQASWSQDDLKTCQAIMYKKLYDLNKVHLVTSDSSRSNSKLLQLMQKDPRHTYESFESSENASRRNDIPYSSLKNCIEMESEGFTKYCSEVYTQFMIRVKDESLIMPILIRLLSTKSSEFLTYRKDDYVTIMVFMKYSDIPDMFLLIESANEEYNRTLSYSRYTINLEEIDKGHSLREDRSKRFHRNKKKKWVNITNYVLPSADNPNPISENTIITKILKLIPEDFIIERVSNIVEYYIRHYSGIITSHREAHYHHTYSDMSAVNTPGLQVSGSGMKNISLIYAAKALASGVISSETAVTAYILLQKFFRGSTELDISDWIEKLSKSKSAILLLLEYDINLCLTWLRTSNIVTPTEYIPKVASLIRLTAESGLAKRITINPYAMAAGKPRKYTDLKPVVDMSNDPDESDFYIGTLLYSKVEIARGLTFSNFMLD